LPIDKDDEESLIESAKSDSQAMSTLYRRHYAPIFGYVHRRIGNAHDASDVVAETFLSMVRYLPRYRWTGAPFRSWLLRLATTQINRWVRRRKWTRFWNPIDETHPASVEPNAARDARIEQLRQALWKLPTRFQDVLALHYLEEHSVESIAEILNCPVGTVKSRLARGRDSLRDALTSKEEKTSDERRAIGWFAKSAEV
jgi:RNA polymerase sigma-70 factor, ECF subfamily